MLAFGALIAVEAMWALQFADARIAREGLGAVPVILLPLALTVPILTVIRVRLFLQERITKLLWRASD